MCNEYIWLSFLFMDFAFLLLGVYFYGKEALYVIISANLVICNIQVLKQIDLFGVSLTFGSISYASTYLATDLLSEIYGKQAAKKAVLLGLASMIFTTIALQVTISLIPSLDDSAHESMMHLFAASPRITIASLVAYFVSQSNDVWIFDWWKQLTKNRHLWLRNNLSTISSQCLDTIIFSVLAFYGVQEPEFFWTNIIATIAIKVLVALCDTPVVYLGRYLINVRENKQDMCAVKTTELIACN